MIAQLHAEIQTLHRSLDEAQRAATLDSLTGFLNRGEFERLLRRDLAIDAQVGVLHIVMPDLPALAAFHPAAVMRELVSSFSKRLTNAVPSGSQLGRWSEDVFCVEAAEPLLRSLSTTVATRCSGTYVCAADGRAVTIPMYPTVTVVRSTDAEGPDALVRKLDRIRHYIAKRMEPVTQP